MAVGYSSSGSGNGSAGDLLVHVAIDDSVGVRDSVPFLVFVFVYFLDAFHQISSNLEM